MDLEGTVGSAPNGTMLCSGHCTKHFTYYKNKSDIKRRARGLKAGELDSAIQKQFLQ